MFAFGLRDQASLNLLLNAHLALDRTDARQDTQSAKGTALTLNTQRQGTGGVMLGLVLAHRHETRDGVEPLCGVRREDRTTSVTLQAVHRSFTLSGFASMMEITREKRRSSLAPARYRNTSVGLSLTRNF